MRASLKYGVVLVVLTVSACMLAGAAGARTLAAPTITAFTPQQGPVGTRITITGANLTGATVDFAGRPATEVVPNPTGTQLVVTVPSYAATGWSGLISVITAEGTVMTPSNFTVTAPVVVKQKPPTIVVPIIRSFTPMRAKVGTKVKITGTKLNGAMWVRFGGVRAVFTTPKTTLIVATVPRNAKSGKISLRTSGGTATSSKRFTVMRPN
jgi:hypothetical protein